jgi:beta-glucosidase
VNSGSPVLLPWRGEVAAILVGYFGGQEMGHAIADILLGVAEPGGRLPTTWPAAEADVPVLSTTPTNGILEYAEGIHIGYRAWLRHEAALFSLFTFARSLGTIGLRVLFVIGIAGLIGAISRLRGRGGVPPTHGGWRELEGPEFR